MILINTDGRSGKRTFDSQILIKYSDTNLLFNQTNGRDLSTGNRHKHFINQDLRKSVKLIIEKSKFF